MSVGNKKDPEILELPGKKKPRRFYAIKGENWNLATRVDRQTLERSQQSYFFMCEEDDLEAKKSYMEKAREFLQVKFRTMEVTEHIYALPDFWKAPHGPQMLSAWFEWLTGNILYSIYKNLLYQI